MLRFEKIPFEQYYEATLLRLSDDKFINAISSLDTGEEFKELIRLEWEELKIPTRSTSGSGGYDFYAPFDFNLTNEEWLTIPTGISLKTDRDDIFMLLAPRSGLGFKNIYRLANTVGIIDSDYCLSSNFGHIQVKAKVEKSLLIHKGKAFIQGIIIPFVKVDNDEATSKRDGGFGSTG